MIDCHWLPQLEICTNLSAWSIYESNIYQIFQSDFISSHPIYLGKRVAVRKHPMCNGKEESFYHVTCKDYFNKNDRQPDIRRCERIRWVRAFIENNCNPNTCQNCQGVKLWDEPSRSNPKFMRTHILLEEERYMVVIEKRENYNLLITAFYIDKDHSLRKILKRYDTYGEQ